MNIINATGKSEDLLLLWEYLIDNKVLNNGLNNNKISIFKTKKTESIVDNIKSIYPSIILTIQSEKETAQIPNYNFGTISDVSKSTMMYTPEKKYMDIIKERENKNL